MSNPLVSVVIPTYNRAHLVCDALNSVVGQIYRPLEILLVDDGSTDQTKQRVNLWWKDLNNKDLLTFQLLQQENLGGNVARNAGIKAATGKYIAFLDSDDTWHPLKIEKQVSVFENNKVGAVYCGLQQMELETNKVIEPSTRSYPSGNILAQMLIRDVTAPTSTYILKREVFEKVGLFDEKLQARQDWDMWIRVAMEYYIGAVPEVLVDFRQHTGERTASDPNKEIRSFKAIRSKYQSILKMQSASVRRKANSTFYKRMGRVHFHHGISISKAIYFYCYAILLNPTDFDAWAAFAGMLLPEFLRKKIHRVWNNKFGDSLFAIRSH